MIHNILTANHQTLSDLADSCGINWSELSTDITFDGRKITHNRIAISKSYRGKCFAVGHKWTAKDGNEYPTIVFYTNKHGGQTEVFDGYKEFMSQCGYSEQYIQSQSKPNYISIEKPPIQALEQWQVTALAAANLAWNTATTENVATHPYVISKKLNVEGLEIRRGNGRFGDCLMVQIFNITGNVTGYQQIYAQNIPNKNTNKHFIGQVGGGFIVIGDRKKIRHGAWITEGVATGLSIYHAEGDGKETLRNKHKMPVICCLSAGNMQNVTRTFTQLGNADLRICADNDNTGIYTAIQCAAIAGAKGYYCPEKLGQKCDFNDTLNFKLLGIGHTKSEQIQQLMRVAPVSNLKKLGDRLAFAMAKQVPYLFSEEQATQIVLDALKARQFDGKCNPAQIIKHSVSERREIIRKRNNITDFTALNRIKIDVLPDSISREINEAIRRKLINIDDPAIIFDPRGLGAGKTELLELMREFLSNEKIAVIIHRVALSYDLSTRLDTDHYKEEEPSGYIRHLTITANSLPKFSIAENGFKILFIDEARQVVDHLIRGTVSNRQAAFDEFVAAIEAADFIICSDADMNDATVAFFKKHANGKKLHVIDAPSGNNNKTLHMVDNHATNFVNISEALNDNQNIFAGCTSKDKAIEAHTFALQNAVGFTEDDLLLIHSENKEDLKQAAFLKNPNAEATKYRGVFHSPTIGSGVSITTPHFISNYFLNSGNLPENECLQMTARNRCATNIFVSCGDQKNVMLITDIALMTEGEGKKAESYLGEFNGVGFAPNELGLLRIELNAVNNHALNDYANNFYLLAEINGYTINRTPFDASTTMTTEIIESKTKNLGKKIKETTCERIHKTDVNATTKKLSKHKQTERDQLDKLATINMAGTPEIDTDDIYRFKFKNVLPVLLNHENLFSSKASRSAWDRVNSETQDKAISKSSLHKLGHTVIVKGIAASTIKNKSRRKRWLDLVAKADSVRAMQAVNKRLSKARLDARQAAKLCRYLKENSAEIAANGLGNYNREFQRPMQILGSFIQHFGYENIEVFKSNAKHLYALQPVDYIGKYAANRGAVMGIIS